MRRHLVTGAACVVLCVVGGAAAAEDAKPGAVDASSVMLPCIPASVYWNGPAPPEGIPQAPDLAVVRIDVRPKNARVHLDDRFVGRARYFDGVPGNLYLEPGAYSLQLHLGGYRSLTVDLDVEAGCTYDLKHRLERLSGVTKESRSGPYGKGRPLQRVYGPVRAEGAVDPGSPSGGPDLALRPDLASRSATAKEAAPAWAALRLNVRPAEAKVAIDGDFAALGRELDRMEAPLATPAGRRVITVEAEGYISVERAVDLEPGQLLELEIELERNPGADLQRD